MPINFIDVSVATGAATSPSTTTSRELLPKGGILRAATVREKSGDGPVHVSIVVFRGETLIELEGTQGWIRSNELGGGKSWHGAMAIEDDGWYISLSSANDCGSTVVMQLSWEVS